MELRGVVVSGRGDWSYWLEKFQAQYALKAGMRLFPGTLNVRLPNPYHLPSDSLRLEKEELGGSVAVSIQPCRIFGRKAFICVLMGMHEATATIRRASSKWRRM